MHRTPVAKRACRRGPVGQDDRTPLPTVRIRLPGAAAPTQSEQTPGSKSGLFFTDARETSTQSQHIQPSLAAMDTDDDWVEDEECTSDSSTRAVVGVGSMLAATMAGNDLALGHFVVAATDDDISSDSECYSDPRLPSDTLDPGQEYNSGDRPECSSDNLDILAHSSKRRSSDEASQDADTRSDAEVAGPGPAHARLPSYYARLLSITPPPALENRPAERSAPTDLAPVPSILSESPPPFGIEHAGSAAESRQEKGRNCLPAMETRPASHGETSVSTPPRNVDSVMGEMTNMTCRGIEPPSVDEEHPAPERQTGRGCYEDEHTTFAPGLPSILPLSTCQRPSSSSSADIDQASRWHTAVNIWAAAEKIDIEHTPEPALLASLLSLRYPDFSSRLPVILPPEEPSLSSMQSSATVVVKAPTSGNTLGSSSLNSRAGKVKRYAPHRPSPLRTTSIHISSHK